jgi:cyclopropane-fatty-acyl-phospholipid synthase
MGILSIEHGKAAYGADFALYGASVVVLAGVLLAGAPREHGVVMAVCVLLGAWGWSGFEYLLHRFVLHGVAPFNRWHAAHHERPMAMICAPTLLSASLIVALVFLPALLLADLWIACALTLGLLAGYFAYGVTHHATHHWRAEGAWLRERKRWHAMHHHATAPCCYGVTMSIWDRVFGTLPAKARVRQRTDSVATRRYKPIHTEVHEIPEKATP